MNVSKGPDEDLTVSVDQSNLIVAVWTEADFLKVVQADAPFGLPDSEALEVAAQLRLALSQILLDEVKLGNELLLTYLRLHRRKLLDAAVGLRERN